MEGNQMESSKVSVRTDLALEAREMAGDIQTELRGIKVDVEEVEDLSMHITTVKVLDKEGEEKIHKPVGTYITIECEAFKKGALDNKKDIVEAVATQIRKVMDFQNKTVLVVGLGNQNVTPDALGPKVVSKLLVTRHLFNEFEDMTDEVLERVSALAPGVMGQTGMETVEIIKGVVDTIGPDVVIAIDALASRKTNRVNSTVQIADTGVHPGSGVGNRRKGLTEETLGVPVIAIGIPTVVDAATIVNDTVEELFEQIKKAQKGGSNIADSILQMEEEEKYAMIQEILYPYVGNLFVTPKEIDEVVLRISDILSLSINRALHPNLEYEELVSWLS